MGNEVLILLQVSSWHREEENEERGGRCIISYIAVRGEWSETIKW